jgi:hypothetical protein
LTLSQGYIHPLYAVKKNGGTMKNKSTNAFACAILLLLSVSVVSVAQKITSLTATAKGQGTLTTADSAQRKINAVGVILREDGEAQITIFTDLQLSAQGRWTVGDELSKGIDLQITGGIVAGNANGTGKVYLRQDGKSIARVSIKAKTPTGGKVTIEFTADQNSGTGSGRPAAPVDCEF